MSWRDKLQPGAFRRVFFSCESSDAEIGRRVALHQYPMRDVPYAEDLGRKARTFTLDMYVFGKDYMKERDALIAALEAPGPGELIHPWRGALRVVVTSVRGPRESTREGGMARFSVTFTEAGEEKFPQAVNDTAAGVDAAADGAIAALEEEAAKEMDVSGPAFIAKAANDLAKKTSKAVGSVRTQLGAVTSTATSFVSDLETFTANVETLVRTPQSFAMSVIGLVQKVALLPDRISRAFGAYRTLGDALSNEKSVPRTTPHRVQQAKNQEAIINLVQRAALVEGVRVSSAMEYESSADAIAIRDELAESLDEAMETASDAVYAALLDLRTAMVKDISARGSRLPRLVTVTPSATLPALVLAHRIYGDATREAEIVERNQVRHPGFVPGGDPLEVIANA